MNSVLMPLQSLPASSRSQPKQESPTQRNQQLLPPHNVSEQHSMMPTLTVSPTLRKLSMQVLLEGVLQTLCNGYCPDGALSHAHQPLLSI